MSGITIFQKINKKLDEGWKLTNVNCPICQTTIVGHPTSKQFYCVKCEMPAKLDMEEDDDLEVEVIGSGSKKGSNGESRDIEEFDNMIISKENEVKKSPKPDLSKKMGELLLQGWAMMEESCYDCLVPYMKSRKGEYVCVGCGPVNKKKEVSPQKPREEEKKIERQPQSIKESKPTQSIYQPQSQDVSTKSKRITEEKPKEPEREPAVEIEPTGVRPNGSVYEFLQLDESVSLLTKMTRLLNKELDVLQEKRLLIDRGHEVLELQRKIDEAKIAHYKFLSTIQ